MSGPRRPAGRPLQRTATTYQNPDTDGVACALALQWLRLRCLGDVVAVFAGELNGETVEVLSRLRLAFPPVVTALDPSSRFVVVDMNAEEQLPPGVVASRVDVVIDHHPVAGGTTIQALELTLNEAVGAAATLVAELARREGRAVAHPWASLLAAGIVSNTLDFRAPSSTARDTAAYEWLTGGEGLPSEALERMRQARNSFLQRSTRDVLALDVKRFTFGGQLLAVAQVEAEGAVDVARREDLEGGLLALKEAQGAPLAMASFVDLESNTTVMASFDPAVSDDLFVRIAGRRGPLIKLDGLALRKTHVLPHLH